MKREIKTIEMNCDFCGDFILGDNATVLYFELTGYTYGGSRAVGIDILASPHHPDIGKDDVHVCKACANKALFNASKTLPEWKHMLRGKELLKDLIAWYDNGQRDMKELDKIYDVATDLFGDR